MCSKDKIREISLKTEVQKNKRLTSEAVHLIYILKKQIMIILKINRYGNNKEITN